MTTIAELEGTPERDPSDFKRDRNGTPSVSDPTGATVKSGDRKGQLKWVKYGRPSSFAGQIENTYNLTKWGERRIVLGVALANLDDLDRTLDGIVLPGDRPAEGWEQIADTVIVDAKQRAKAFEAGEQGTHAHSLTEDHDDGASWLERAERGEELGIPAEAADGLVAAWRLLLDAYGLEVLAIETKVVHDGYRQAGTLDRLVRLTRDLSFMVNGVKVTLKAGTVVVLDIKTGKLKLDYWNGYAVQIAVYAGAVPYDTATESRGQWEWAISQEWALIAHLPVADAIAGEPKARLILVDIAKGRQAADLCLAAKQWESDAAVFGLGLEMEYVAPEPVAAEPARRIPGTLPPRDVPIWTATMPDESEMMADPADAHKIKAAYAKRTPEQRAVVDALLKEAQRAGVPYGQLIDNPTVRRFEAARATFRVADHLDGDDDLTRAALRLVLGDRPEVAHAPLGALIGSLTAAEARQLSDVLDQVGGGQLVADFTDGPALRAA